MFEAFVVAVGILIVALVGGAVGTFLERRARRRRAQHDAEAFVTAHGLTVREHPPFALLATGSSGGHDLRLTFATVRLPDASTATHVVSLRLRGPRRYGRVLLAHPDRIDQAMKQAAAPLGHGRVVATLPDATDPDWLRPDVVAAMAALPSTAHLETADDHAEVEFRDHVGPPPLEAALQVLRRIVDGPAPRAG